LYSIQYLRAFAAYFVVLFHISASLNSQTGGNVVFAVGAVGVDIFFVLSGFLMAMIVAENHEIDTRFLMRRFLRIAPLYYLVTLVLFTLAVLSPFLVQAGKASFGHLLASLLFVPFPSASGSVTPILTLGWTLNYEMFFYFLIALTTFLFRDRTLGLTVIFMVVLVIAGHFADLGPVWDFYTDPIILEFAAGILVYRYIFCDKRPRNSGIFAFLIAGGLLALAIDPQTFPGSERLIRWGMPATLIVTGGIFALNFRIEWLKKLGDWSYSTYLVHIYIVQLMVKVLVPGGWSGLATPLALAAVTIPLTIAASGFLYANFEMPVVKKLGALAGLRRQSSANQPATFASPAITSGDGLFREHN